RVRRPTLFSLWRKARRENSAASRLLGSTSLRFALHGWQRTFLFHLDAKQRFETAPQIGGHGGSERNDDREQGIDEKGGAFLAQSGF
ncbi:hypothetical protein, partial [Thiolapillus sp.]|uniref:hypothetical protein n=1 Tax=Thiolapillus sp. TaxID=2017437 RepID=UPI0025EF1FC1